MYCASLMPIGGRALLDHLGVNKPPRMPSALTALARMPSRAVVERVLPHQCQGRGLWQTIRAEIRAGVDRLL